MAKRTEALINPAILVWARRTSHFDLETAARRAKVEPDHLLQWETGEARPSVPQLRKLATAYKRPLALFYLDELPRDFKPIEDYRRIDPDFELTVSPELALEMRKAHTRREIAVDAAQELDELPPPFQFALENRRDPEAAGEELRQFLGLGIADQQAWRSRGEAYSRWRRLFESKGILTFPIRGSSPWRRSNRDVVTYETRSTNIAKPEIPDVCDAEGIETIDLIEIVRREGWSFRSG